MNLRAAQTSISILEMAENVVVMLLFGNPDEGLVLPGRQE